ncbi:MAG: pyruvate:ferredoxin (flavodoxin) oxidoreductase [Bacilli bacterium]|nr:pyruvate:ferredoxin (flavodoxin) oxidoreductase [Bacilli bacterium]MDD4076408.1 pyruvate:ferredoxin (flavodoxin) oxidoreductase [Bacilli bacterium]
MAKKIFESMDGNEAAAWASYAFTEVAGIYPITPSSPMAEYVDEWASKGKKNLFGMPVNVIEMQSEAGAAGTVHGSLQAGALTTTFTASQGLLLKVPNMYKIAGELLPGVIHVSARSIAVQALSIFGDHQDVMATRQTGFAIMATSSVQEVMDLAGVAHLSAIKSSIPFLHFFDGFRTSHEIQKIEVMDYEVYRRLLDYESVDKFRKRALNPNKPVTRGSAQNDDVYFQAREAQNKYYDRVPGIVEEYMREVSKITGRNYAPFVYYGDPEATDIIIAMGSVTETIKEVVDYLREKEGKKVGIVTVHLYRPFSNEHLFKVIPTTVKRIAVLDRTKEQGANGEPLYLDVKSAFYGRENAPVIVGGRYGLSSKDTDPGQIFAVYSNLEKGKEAKTNFTIGIIDDVTNLSLNVTKDIDTCGQDVSQLIFYGLGSDGTVGANKNTVKLIGENTDYYAQAYFAYDSKKSGGVTRSHLRFGKNPIRSPYLVKKANFISCSLDTYTEKYNMLRDLKEGGTFLLNTTKPEKELIEFLPNSFKKALADKKAKFYVIDAVNLARDIGLGQRTNTIMQSAFFKLNEQIMPYDEAKELMKKYAHNSYIKKGIAVVELNYKAIETGSESLKQIEVDPTWSNLKPEEKKEKEGLPKFVLGLANPVNALKGDELPVSAFDGYEDGTMDNGSTTYEKRYTASFVPTWIKENCIQCNQCSFVCPHAVIRPFLSTADEVNKSPKGSEYLEPVGKGLEGLKYSIVVSIADCTGCEVCVNQCPGRKGQKALQMVSIDEAIHDGKDAAASYFFDNVTYKTDIIDINLNVKNSQFAQPLFEFHGACGGCGETPYIKLATQLFGEDMIIANATGCSSIYGGSFPATPYRPNKEGKGPAWANSLFEDNAEFGFGIHMASETIRNRIQQLMEQGLECSDEENSIKVLFKKWIENRNSRAVTKEVTKELVPLLEKSNCMTAKEIFKLKDYLVKRSQWIFGGDGWAYDIGFGGLDHVIANHQDVNILVLDTEVYSNTGGQSSKSSQTGSIAKFTAAGKKGKKKDLAAIAMSYGHVYVAQIASGYSQAQMLKAFLEAESYDGPSIIIAYSPCIAHGIKAGMGNTQKQSKLAVECGYWTCFRYDPRLVKEGKNPFILDSKEPNWDIYEEHLMSERRYAQLKQVNRIEAEKLLQLNRQEAQRRYAMYKRYVAMDYSK